MKWYIIIGILLSSACAVPSEEESLGEDTQNNISLNGISFNGISLNGTSVNGKSLNGISLNGISFNGTSLSGVTIKANSASGPPMAGLGLVGSTWTSASSNGTSVKLRIDGAAQGTVPNADLWYYAISYQTTTGWNPLCGLDVATGQPVQAVSVAGVWGVTAADSAHYASSTTQFTLACRDTTVAKCVELGYKTYKGYSNQLMSCVRMLRGDFCGTGSAYTINGTLLNVYDNVGVQLDTQAWAPEAEWTPTGARCVSDRNNGRYQLVLSYDPRCVQRIQTWSCGTSFSNGAVLIDELSPAAQAAIQAAQNK
jgi:hypothetical protein